MRIFSDGTNLVRMFYDTHLVMTLKIFCSDCIDTVRMFCGDDTDPVRMFCGDDTDQVRIFCGDDTDPVRMFLASVSFLSCSCRIFSSTVSSQTKR